MSTPISTGPKTSPYGTFTGASSSTQVIAVPDTADTKVGTQSSTVGKDEFVQARNTSNIDWKTSPEVPTNSSERIAHYMAYMPEADTATTATIKTKISTMEKALANTREKTLPEAFKDYKVTTGNKHLNMNNADDFMQALTDTKHSRLLNITNNHIGKKEAALRSDLY